MPLGGEATTDEHFNTETDEGTIAMHKKRSRRVSFAELTSVHVFVRDADNDTPTDPEPSSPDPKLVKSNNGLGLRRQDSADGEYSKESTLNNEDGDDDDDDGCSGRRLFLRPMESPSPGGSTMGSATSNDEDEFFGPVSAHFIKPGRFSDSAASDENQERTMDSTAFSLHFRSLARSDLGDMTAPTNFKLSLDAITPNKNLLSATLGDSLTVTNAKNKVSDTACINKLSIHEDSGGMSLVGKDTHRYDYAKLSPGLDALLAESQKELQADVVLDNTSVVKSPVNNNIMPLVSDATGLVRSHETMSVSKVILEDENNGILPGALAEPAVGVSSDIGKVSGSNVLIDQRNWSAEYSSRGPQHMNTDGTEVPRQNPVICNEVFGIISNDASVDALHERPSFDARLTPLSARRKMDLASFGPSKTHVSTPIQGTPSSMARYELMEHCESISSVQRSISRLKRLESSPFSSSVKVKLASEMTPIYLCKTSPPTVALEEVKSITIKPYADPFTPQKNNDVLKMNNPASPIECINNQSISLTAHDGDNSNTHLGHDMDLGKRIEHVDLSSIPANGLDTLSARGQYKSPHVHKSKISPVLEPVCDRDFENYNTQDMSETIGNDITRLAELESNSTQRFASETSLHLQMNHISEGEMRSEKETFSCGAYSPLSYMTCNEPQPQELSRKKISKMTNNDSVPSLGLPPADQGQDANLYVNIVESKRRRDDVISSMEDSLEEILPIQRSLKLRKVADDSITLVEQPEESVGEMFSGQEKTTLKHWDGIFSKFVADKNQLVSILHDKASLQIVGQLLDLLVQQQRLKQYEFLRMENIPKQKLHSFENHQQKRVAEATKLLHRIAHKHAELQLMSVKHEMLLKKAQLVNVHRREFQMLKSSYQSSSSVPCTKAPAEKCDNNPSANSESNHEYQVSVDKVNAMRQILEASSKKIHNLTKFFHTAFRIKGEPTSIETTALVNNILKRRVHCRFLSQDLKLWEVADIESRAGHHTAILNYYNVIVQRLAIDLGSVTNIVVSNHLDEKTILKNFPNMNAVMAFASVLNTHASQKKVEHRSLSQETQITGSVLGNLLDVIEEVQQTRIKIPNLISSRFCSSSAEKLELHICFLNLRSGRKVAFALNLSCLNWGIYPTEAIPIVLEDGTLPKLVAEELTKLRAAIQSVKAGYSRIFRLCSYLSELVENSDSEN